MSGARRVEIFMGPVAVTCAGGPTPARQEKITRALILRSALEKEHAGEYEVITWDLGKKEMYDEGIGLLRNYLREDGQGELADRVAFAINNVTPSVAVDGRLVCFNDCPEVEEFLRAESGPERGGS